MKRLYVLPLALLLATACGGGSGESEVTEEPAPKHGDEDGHGDGGDDGGEDGGEDGGDFVAAPRGPARPEELPAAKVDCAAGESQLQGRFVAPNGETPVAGAWVYIAAGDCWAGTGADGSFAVRGLPEGETVVRAEKGLFRAEAVGSTGAPLQLRVEQGELKLAHFEGLFDSMDQVLADLGFESTPLDPDALATTDLTPWDVVFFNCGMGQWQAEEPAVQEALRAYVEGGGRIYLSDWADVFVSATFPGRIGFASPDARLGAMGEQTATVHDEALVRALGKRTATVGFDAPMWTVIDSVADDVEILVSGPVETVTGESLGERPYLVQFGAGEGRVTFTSFHHEQQPTDDVRTLLEQLVFQL
mgnify:CR=1 FL=1